MNNIRIQKHRGRVVIFGRLVYEDGLPAQYTNVILEGICPVALNLRKPEKCKRCKLSSFKFLSLTTTDKNGDFIFVVRNSKLVYSIRIVNELIK